MEGATGIPPVPPPPPAAADARSRAREDLADLTRSAFTTHVSFWVPGGATVCFHFRRSSERYWACEDIVVEALASQAYVALLFTDHIFVLPRLGVSKWGFIRGSLCFRKMAHEDSTAVSFEVVDLTGIITDAFRECGYDVDYNAFVTSLPDILLGDNVYGKPLGVNVIRGLKPIYDALGPPSAFFD